MRVLIVGAGAVGQVFAFHLKRAGAHVAFFAKEKYAEDAKTGFEISRLGITGKRERTTFAPHEVFTRAEELEKLPISRNWDYVINTVSSTAIREAWLDPFISSVTTRFHVMIQAGLEDEGFMLKKIPGQKLIRSLIGLMSYKKEGGIEYYVPPRSGIVFSGPSAGVAPIKKALNSTGLRTTQISSVPTRLAYAAAISMPALIGIEHSEWDLGRFRRSENLKIYQHAATEALSISERYRGERLRPFSFLGSGLGPLMGWQFGAFQLSAKALFPFDVEAFLKKHFMKVRNQTDLYMHQYIELGGNYGIKTHALESQMKRIEAKRKEHSKPEEQHPSTV